MPPPSVLIVAPNSFELFTGTTMENQFHLLTAEGRNASLLDLDRLLLPGNLRAPLTHRRENPMAGYYLESFLKQRGYAAAVVFDFDRDDLILKALRTGPLAVLFSTTYVTDPRLLALCLERLRRLAPGLPLIVGGPYIWKQKRELLELRARPDAREYVRRMRDFDADVLGDNLFAGLPDPAMEDVIFIGHEFGEYSLLGVLDFLARGADRSELYALPNLVLGGPDGFTLTEHREEPVDLERDYTRWDLIDAMPRVVPLRTSVGCPFRCRYCDFIELHPQIRMRSPASLRREIELALARGRSVFDFIDDNVFLTKERIAHLTRTLIEAELGIQWGGFFRADRVEEDNVADIRRSGCIFGLCGVESGDGGLLRNMRKGADPGRVARGLRLALEHGIHTALTFIVGFPGESSESIERTAAFASALPLFGRAFPSYQIFPFYVLPGTAVDAPAFRERFGLHGRMSAWSHATMDAFTASHEYSRLLFGNTRIPYNYAGNDSPAWWSVERRNRAFAARKDLTDAFLDASGDVAIQRRFAALVAIVRAREDGSEGAADAAIPAWDSVLADRSVQPGRRVPIERIGAFVPARSG